MPRKPITATPGRIASFDRLRPYFDLWPTVFPTTTNPVVKPLAITTKQALRARLVVPDGMTQEEVLRAINATIRAYTRSPGYLLAMSQPDSQRHDLDGQSVEPVTDQHRRDAQAGVEHHRKIKAQGLPGPPSQQKPVAKVAVEPPVNVTDEAVALEPAAPAGRLRVEPPTVDVVCQSDNQCRLAAVAPPPKVGKSGRPILKLKAPVGR
jgi:sRNA-binding protein